jgi:hypothetical protein
MASCMCRHHYPQAAGADSLATSCLIAGIAHMRRESYARSVLHTPTLGQLGMLHN